MQRRQALVPWSGPTRLRRALPTVRKGVNSLASGNDNDYLQCARGWSLVLHCFLQSQQKCSQNQASWSQHLPGQQTAAGTGPSGHTSPVHRAWTGATASLLRLFLLLVCSYKAETPKCPRTSLQHFWHTQAQKVQYVSSNGLLMEDLQPDFQARFQAKLASGTEHKAVRGHPHASSC